MSHAEHHEMWHEGHDVVFLTPLPPKEGAPFGPHCIDCNATLLVMRIPGPEDMAKAKQWVVDHPEIMAQFSDPNA